SEDSVMAVACYGLVSRRSTRSARRRVGVGVTARKGRGVAGRGREGSVERGPRKRTARRRDTQRFAPARREPAAGAWPTPTPTGVAQKETPAAPLRGRCRRLGRRTSV